MSQSQDPSCFVAVDETSDPRFFIEFLDARKTIEGEREVKEPILRMLALHEGDSVLDVGCGTGDDDREIAGLVGIKKCVVGIDPSEAMIAESKRRAEGSGLPVHFQCVYYDPADFSSPRNSTTGFTTRTVSTTIRPPKCTRRSRKRNRNHASADYVYRETKRARAGLQGTKTLLWPGIDVDIPTNPASSKCTPEGTREAVLAAFHGGADGVLISRKYSEMKLANLKGVGAAVHELGLA